MAQRGIDFEDSVGNRTESICDLAASITKAASKQTYYTVYYLVDGNLIPAAYRAYAYFRWVDDRLDQRAMERPDRLAFLKRQAAVIECCYQGECMPDLTPEERMAFDLIRGDREQNSGLQTYVRSMTTVMAFDAERQGRLISQLELAEYSRSLAIAVTEALHYFIGHDSPSPRSKARYFAATAAHITHMLRDTLEDIEAGYFNIPRELLTYHRITPWDVGSDAYRAWVRSRVRLARAYFKAGKSYLAQVENLRCRLAGHAYIARFQGVLDAIEREGYQLRPEYRECKNSRAVTRAIWSTFSSALGQRRPSMLPHALPDR